jgi:hypothetical protein
MNFLLSRLFGGLSQGGSYGRRSSYGRMPRSHGSYGRSRTTTGGGFLGSPMGRMAMGGLATYAMRRFFNRRRVY